MNNIPNHQEENQADKCYTRILNKFAFVREVYFHKGGEGGND
jgi:hypothetical protein